MKNIGKKQVWIVTVLVTILFTVGLAVPWASKAGTDVTSMTKYILETVKAFRTVYAKGVTKKAKEGGMKTDEGWRQDAHALMLPAQFVKAAATQIKGYELGLIGNQPIYKSNLPKSEAEKNALQSIMASRNSEVVVFRDGNKVVGLMGDFAVAQSCVDCHNAHPRSPKKDYKMGDLMGALVVRIND